MDRILVRFNTKFAEDPLKRGWRVLVNGEEQLAHRVDIQVPCETITEPISTGEIKHHFLCFGYVHHADDEQLDHVVRILDYPNLHDLTKIALGYDVSLALEQVEFSEPHYFRKQIYKDDGLEIVLVCFKRGQETSRHDHGVSSCVVRCLQGSVTEYLYLPNLSKCVDGNLMEGGLQVVKAGDSHEVVNHDEEKAVLLNFYAPPLKAE